MNGPPPDIDAWIEEAKRGELSWTELAERLLTLEYGKKSADRPDLDRERRCRFGEVIYGQGKTPDAVVSISTALLESGQSEVLVTRASPDHVQAVSAHFPHHFHDAVGGTLRLSNCPINTVRDVQYLQEPELDMQRARIEVVTAGSTDAPVAHECVETLRWMGVHTDLITDVGVAGPYRLLPYLERLRRCAAIVVVAGMEGALASVVGGLVPCPVIAVPTSVGYGAHFEGLASLLSMINSCAASVTVVNIDAGFKGGYVAGLIAHQVAQSAT